MTDSMNFGPEWLRNLSSEGTTTSMSNNARCQLADYRYGREEMLALFEKSLPPPPSLSTFPPLYSEQVLPPLALVPATEEERQWVSRGPPMGPALRGRGAPVGGAGERGGRIARGSARGAYQPFGRTIGSGYDGGSAGVNWAGTGEQTEWSPRKDFVYNRSSSSGGIDNWRRSNRTSGTEEEDGWRSTSSHGRSGGSAEKWTRSSSWREGDDDNREKRWHESNVTSGPRGAGSSGSNHRRLWDAQDEHLPEWATENLAEGGGTFDSTGAFHGSDEENAINERDRGKELQKSASQQNVRNQHAPLVTSKSAVALSGNKKERDERKAQEVFDVETNREANAGEDIDKEGCRKDRKEDGRKNSLASGPDNLKNVTSLPPGAHPPDLNNANSMRSNSQMLNEPNIRGVDEDFDRLQEDFVSKLVVDEEPPKTANPPTASMNVPLSNGIPAPPPNIMPAPSLQEKWYYQDPQGDLQGPFVPNEMAEWFNAGYFSLTLFVRRHCDERFITLGELVALCKGGNPFQSAVALAPLKRHEPEKINEPEIPLHLHHQIIQAQLMRARTFGQTEPWNNLSGMQRELYGAAAPIMPPMGPELIPPGGTGTPLLHHMLTQFKMPTPVSMPTIPTSVLDEPASPMPLDPLRALVQQMGGLQNLQNRLPPQQMKHDPSATLSGTMHGLPVNGTVPNLGGVSTLLPPPKSDTTAGAKLDGDFLQFMQQHAAMNKSQPQPPPQQQPIDLETFWKHSQFASPPPPTTVVSQHQQQPQVLPPPQLPQAMANLQGASQWPQTDKPISMWDTPTVQTVSEMQQVRQCNMPLPPTSQSINQVPETIISSDHDKRSKKEEKRQKELEDKQAKKDADERRKQEQRKHEQEKKQQEEKRRREEERVKKELEKAKREAEEKRQKELAEKKRLKELRKEEEVRKKAEELKKQQEEEKERLAAKEREEQRKQLELQRQYNLSQTNQKPAKVAPWSQAVNNQGLSLAEIQKLERERKAEQLLLQQQQQQQQQRQVQQALQEQSSPERTTATGLHLNWANKPVRHNNVKSLAEIQAEEQDRLLKQKEKEKAAQKEKETLSPQTSTIWSGQTLTWNNSDSTGFWDEPVPYSQPQQQKTKQAAGQAHQQPKSNANKQQQQKHQPTKQAQQVSAKQKRDEHAHNNTNSNNSSQTNSVDEFANWCTSTLASMNTQVDIPTFVSFLRDIESALDVRDYCRDYLGDKPATQQFAAQFLEKRRSFKPKQNAHKDDMCSPAPAITPSTQHNNDFQEVKGKGKKCKKSKMMKVDARILGFNVTAAQDRINVGDRDYGEP